MYKRQPYIVLDPPRDGIHRIRDENEFSIPLPDRKPPWLIYNDPAAYADLVLNGDPETYLKTVTEYKPTSLLTETIVLYAALSLILIPSTEFDA